MWVRKVFCEKCGAQIDTLVSQKKESSGIGEAIVLGDSRKAHYEKTGCADDHRGWQFGPWKELSENKAVKGKIDKLEWPAMSAYAERNDVPDDALGENPIQFLRDMSISSGPPFNPLEQEEYARFVGSKQPAYCIYHPETELVNGLCNKCQYGPRSERTCMGCRWHWSAPSGDGSAGTADHKCLAVDQSDGSWHFGALPMQGAKFIDELNHTRYPPVPSWCPCVQIPVTEEQVEFTEHLPAIHCDKGHLDLMGQNVLLRAEVSQLKARQKGNSEEYYAEIRRFQAAVDKEDGLPEGQRVTVDLTPRAAQEVDRLRLIFGFTTADLFRYAIQLVKVTEDCRAINGEHKGEQK